MSEIDVEYLDGSKVISDRITYDPTNGRYVRMVVTVSRGCTVTAVILQQSDDINFRPKPRSLWQRICGFWWR